MAPQRAPPRTPGKQNERQVHHFRRLYEKRHGRRRDRADHELPLCADTEESGPRRKREREPREDDRHRLNNKFADVPGVDGLPVDDVDTGKAFDDRCKHRQRRAPGKRYDERTQHKSQEHCDERKYDLFFSCCHRFPSRSRRVLSHGHDAKKHRRFFVSAPDIMRPSSFSLVAAASTMPTISPL